MKNPDEVIALIRSLNLGQIKKQLDEDAVKIDPYVQLADNLRDFDFGRYRVNGFIAFLEAAAQQPPQ